MEEVKIPTETLPWGQRLLAQTKDQAPPQPHLRCSPATNKNANGKKLSCGSRRQIASETDVIPKAISDKDGMGWDWRGK